jgi:peroxiredoxin
VQRLVAALSLVLAFAACSKPRLVLQPQDRMPAAGPKGEDPPLVTNETAPAAVVQNRDGGNVDLASIWGTKRVLLVFYMGHWCPHCQKQLGELNERMADFGAKGVTIVAVSNDPADDMGALHDKLHLGFDLFTDPELATVTRWGALDAATNVARPSVFIIEPGGAISYRHIGESQTDRPTVDQLLAALSPPTAAAQ